MKRYLGLIFLAAAVAAGSYAVTRGLLAPAKENEAAWLQREFKLNSAQSAAIAKLQADYQPVCLEHCRMIREARDRQTASPADAAQQAEIERLEGVCIHATLAHLKQVAAQMTPAEGERFLSLVEPHLSRREHQGPLALQPDPGQK